MRNLYRALIIYHVFIGVGALVPGIAVIIDPSGDPMGISTDILKRAPFEDFLIPGLFLFGVIGLGSLLAGFTAYKKIKLQAYVSGTMGVVLTMWIIIQCYMLADIAVLHIIYFFLGLIGIALAIVLAYRQQLFPFTK